MIGTGSWVATRNAKSARLYVERLNLQKKLREERAQRRRDFFGYWWSLIRKLFRRRR